MKNLKWPEDPVMSANCPVCRSVKDVQIELVREMGLPGRPDECRVCGCEFDLDHTGKTTPLIAHPARTTQKGRMLLAQEFVFEPDCDEPSR
ncbi:hypothetical protein L6R44_10500 [Enterobacter cloacae complex sp. ECC445]|uniref:hypothetical protein n=1 Tax=Enterobacter cloacae complex sp. ECC445 TaxID=2913213 RepID=UPI001F4226D2|nr:hypothetical protein [Enterobacter cloacae complex sp. ECC445]MCG0456534.1 hypothetical protein [Enterobacter cloacae complex sp. ECC445]